jgi:hypothetical protein
MLKNTVSLIDTTLYLYCQGQSVVPVLGNIFFPFNHTKHMQDNSQGLPGFPNSAAQQPRETQQRGAYQ